MAYQLMLKYYGIFFRMHLYTLLKFQKRHHSCIMCWKIYVKQLVKRQLSVGGDLFTLLSIFQLPSVVFNLLITQNAILPDVQCTPVRLFLQYCTHLQAVQRSECCAV